MDKNDLTNPVAQLMCHAVKSKFFNRDYHFSGTRPPS